MKFKKKTTAVVMGLTVAAALTACGSSGTQDAGGSQTADRGEYDLKILNFKGEIADDLSKMCREYEKEFGVKVDEFTIGTGEDINGIMRAAMNSEDKPSLYSCGGYFIEWKEGGYILDLSTVEDTEFQEFMQTVNDDMILKDLDGNGSYGVPLCVEGYGFIADKRMLSDILGADKVDAFLTDYKKATYEEYEAMVNALDTFIKDGKEVTFTLNKTEYTTQAKSGLAENLYGVFSVAGADPWTYVGHYVTGPVSSVLKTERDALLAAPEQVDKLNGGLQAYVKALELATAHTAGQNGALSRGDEYIQSVTNGYDQAVQNFALGKSVLLAQGTWAYTKIIGENPETADSLVMLPFKFPLTQQDICVEGYTPETINQDVVQLIPQYWAVNAKVSEKEQKEAERFLKWMHTSETGRKYITEIFKFVPYNATEEMDLGNSLNNSFLSYQLEGNVYNYAAAGAPGGWSDEVGAKVKEEYLTKETWSKEDMDTLVEFMISDWKGRLEN